MLREIGIGWRQKTKSLKVVDIKSGYWQLEPKYSIDSPKRKGLREVMNGSFDFHKGIPSWQWGEVVKGGQAEIWRLQTEQIDTSIQNVLMKA